ncbi:MAG: FtsX-like permease family protein [Chloroflexota bacterium]|nr:FtsX-like permease family protein [Chloroflexota bacterium]
MEKVSLKFLAYIAIAFKRLKAKKRLTILLIIAFALTIAVTICIPVFAGAVGRSVVQEKLESKNRSVDTPLFSARFYAMPTASHPMTLDDVSYAHEWLADLLDRQVGIPIKSSFVQSESSTMRLLPTSEDARYDEAIEINVVCVQNIGQRIRVVEGTPFDTVDNENRMSVWVLSSFADRLGVHVGETFDLAYSFRTQDEPIQLKVKGFWEPIDHSSSFWYDDPETLYRDSLLTSRKQYETYIERVAPEGTGFNFWYYILDDSKMNLNYATRYIHGLQQVRREVERRLPREGMDRAPVKELKQGRERKDHLSILLLALSIPLVGMLVLFMALISSIVAHSQRQEIAILISRGASQGQIFILALVETLLLLVIACPVGILGGLGLARLIGFSRGFLSFARAPSFMVHFASIDWRFFVVASLVCLVARLVSSNSVPGFSIVSYERHHMTGRQKLRTAARLLLLVSMAAVTAYAYSRLEQRGTLGHIATEIWSDPAQDPLVLLSPSLFLFAASFLAAETFTIILLPLGFLGRFSSSTAGHLACTNLARGANRYRMAVYMLALCLSMGVFYAAIAKSADTWFLDRLRYKVGADLTFEQAVAQGEGNEVSPLHTWIPLSEFEELPGVDGATRVGQFIAETSARDNVPKFRLLAIERSKFPQIAYFRSDFSESSLGGLMNSLARRELGILLPESLAVELHVTKGDELPLDVLIGEKWYPMRFSVAGTFRYFPTMVNPEKEPVVVASLGQLQREIGSFPHEIWMSLEPGAEGKQVTREVKKLGISAIRVGDLKQYVARDRQRLERVGIFGTLSVSFLTALLLASSAAIINNVASISRRSYFLSVLRAIGMEKAEVLELVSVEYLVVIAYGIAAGVIIGSVGAKLYVPFFPFTLSAELPVPPYIPYMDLERAGWMTASMGVLFVALGGMTLLRIADTRLFEVLRLGVKA